MADTFSPATREPLDRGAPSWGTPRAAARALYLATGTLLASMVAISLYFGGAGDFWGPVNDLLVVATVLLLLPAMAALHHVASGTAGRWLTLVTALAGAGVSLIGAGQLALVAGLVTLETSFVTGGIGVLPVIVWLGATVTPSVRTALASRAVAVWAAAFLALIAGTVALLALVTTDTPTLTSTLGVALVAVLVGWLVSLARALDRVSARS